jgi:hypothetical protein
MAASDISLLTRVHNNMFSSSKQLHHKIFSRAAGVQTCKTDHGQVQLIM